MGFNECVRGRISINDEDVNAGLINRLRKVCGYLPQRPYLGEGKVLGQINDLLPESGQVQTAIELCRDFGLPERTLQAPAERLSGGELQRLTLSLLLSREPQLLMLDEPSAALDGFSRKRLIDILQEHKIGGLMISHDEYLTEALADSTVTLEAIA